MNRPTCGECDDFAPEDHSPSNCGKCHRNPVTVQGWPSVRAKDPACRDIRLPTKVNRPLTPLAPAREAPGYEPQSGC